MNFGVYAKGNLEPLEKGTHLDSYVLELFSVEKLCNELSNVEFPVIIRNGKTEYRGTKYETRYPNKNIQR